MKKIVSLLCSLILILFLCACQGGSHQKSGQPQGKRTAEEAVADGTLLSTVDLMDEAEADAEAANKTYAGKYYLMNLAVDRLNDPEYIRAGFNIRYDFPLKTVYFTADLPEEEREGLALGDVLQIVGKIAKIEKRFNGMTFVEVSDAHCVTKTFQISGTVVAIDSAFWYSLIVSDDSGHVFPNSEITVYPQGNGNYKEGDRITAVGTLRDGILPGHSCVDPYAWPFYMESPESVEIVIEP